MDESGLPKDGGLILSIDAGTQSMRAGLVDLAGNLHGLVKIPIEPYVSPQPGWAEQSPAYYWAMLCRTTRQLLAESAIPTDRIRAVTITTQRHTLINVDRDGNELRPAIVWLDQRKAEMRKVLPGYGIALTKLIRQYPFFEYVTEFCRSNWIRQNQPDIWQRTHKFLGLSGYLSYHLTGEFVDSAGNQVGTVRSTSRSPAGPARAT